MEPELKPMQPNFRVHCVIQPGSCTSRAHSMPRRDANPDYLRDMQKTSGYIEEEAIHRLGDQERLCRIRKMDFIGFYMKPDTWKV